MSTFIPTPLLCSFQSPLPLTPHISSFFITYLLLLYILLSFLLSPNIPPFISFSFPYLPLSFLFSAFTFSLSFCAFSYGCSPKDLTNPKLMLYCLWDDAIGINLKLWLLQVDHLHMSNVCGLHTQTESVIGRVRIRRSEKSDDYPRHLEFLSVELSGGKTLHRIC